MPVINQNTVFILNTHNSDAQRRLLARLLINHESIDDLNTDDENDGDDVSFDFSNKLYDIFKICLNAFITSFTNSFIGGSFAIGL